MSIEGNQKIIDELTERSEKWEAKTPRRTPHKGAASVNNSNTSPKKVVIRRNQARALTYREQGYTYEQIAAQMKRPPQTIHRWVMQAMDRLIDEPARRVLALELRRLDRLQSGVYTAAAEGDLPAIKAYLDIADRRAKLLGLYPKEGAHASLSMSRANADGGVDSFQIEFKLPDGKTFSLDDVEEVAALPDPGRSSRRQSWIIPGVLSRAGFGSMIWCRCRPSVPSPRRAASGWTKLEISVRSETGPFCRHF